MEMRLLGDSGISVSSICLGTMTFGQQNTEAEAHAQLDFAVAQGVNFIDAAEMYPVPPKAETQGRTESYIGSWLVRQARDSVVVATKIAGPSRGMKWIRGGPQITAPQIRAAIDGSLRRLRTDYVDLYQIHWPERYVPMFGERYYEPARQRAAESIENQLRALGELVQAGKVRAIGLSNETPYGVMSFAQAAREHGFPRVVSIQNAYHLMNRTFETGGLAEVSTQLNIGLLPYSPLAFGLLSGKYLSDPSAAGRLTEFPGFGQRYAKPNVAEATRAYVALAQRHGLSPAQMAIAFTRQKPFTTSVIIGATSITQLAENIGAADVTLSAELLAEVDEIDQRWPNPAP
ncbi:aldo/keto reductase [Halothiobacillus diazotrophicus]|uniref:Protein tas n=1 Tax=Halothiobacillus diazotrophicus TaxID=1860122 RepID=A0A191ZGH0_9GAMM|nr:aldo/keto reductase [Halothiobacillus diazotrophicus]ANJ66981.1 aldo/keto reductase [Halothiobacillus diazotrophicus]